MKDHLLAIDQGTTGSTVIRFDARPRRGHALVRAPGADLRAG